MNKNSLMIKKIAILSVSLAAAIILNILDSFIPMPGGFRIGLANVISIFLIYIFGFKEALIIAILRVLFSSLLRGTFLSFTFYFALGGGIMSVLIMFLAKKILPFGMVVVSVFGALVHSATQIIIAVFLVGGGGISFDIIWQALPPILLLSVPTGVLTGIVGDRAFKIYQKVENKL